jgi:hypothetical protein
MNKSAYANAVYAVRIIHNANLVGAEKYSALAAAIAAEAALWAAGNAAFNAARSARFATWDAALAARHAEASMEKDDE